MCKRKTIKPGESAELDQVMMKWFKLCESESVELSDNLVKEQVRIFHEELGLDYQCDYSISISAITDYSISISAITVKVGCSVLRIDMA